MNMKLIRIAVVATALILIMAVGVAQDNGVVDAFEDLEEQGNLGWFMPDHPLYGLETAVDRVGMSLGVVSPGAVAEKRANEARSMADAGNWEAAERAANGLERAAAQAGDADIARLETAMATLEEVVSDAPEEALAGLETAIDNIRQAGPAELPGTVPEDSIPDEGPVDDPGEEDTDVTDDPAPGTGPVPTPIPDADPDEEITTVRMNDMAFDQDEYRAEPGKNIVFVNHDDMEHTVTIPAEGVDEVLGPQDRLVVVIEDEGEYELDCTVHAGMDATIIIEE